MIEVSAICMVALGALIMIWNICGYLRFNRKVSGLHSGAVCFPRRLLITYLILLLFFLLGYVGIAVGMSHHIPVSDVLVGMILFWGSVFVLIGLRLQFSMSNAIRKTNLELIQALVAAVEARDPDLNGHSVHVERLVRLLYNYIPRNRQLQFDLAELEYAALLHDIGKLGVPEAVLNKKETLDEKEWDEIRKHPRIGSNILSRVEGLSQISKWILYHHERCDGKGFYGLAYQEIPYPSRMLSVADTFSAVTMNRTYRAGKGYEQAMEILKECSGTQLDSELVDCFLKIPKDEVEKAGMI